MELLADRAARCATATSSRRASCRTRSTCSRRSSSPCVAIDDDWTSAALFDLVRRAYPYHALTRAAFDEVLAMLVRQVSVATSPPSSTRALSGIASPTRSRRRARRAWSPSISGGTIPDRGLYTVNLPDRTRLGELDEEFVHETRVGDVFQLGSSTWRVNAIEHDRVIVDARARRAGANALLARRVRGALVAPRAARRRAAPRARRRAHRRASSPTLADALRRRRGDDALARRVRAVSSAPHAASCPTSSTLVVEQFRDEIGRGARRAPRAVRRTRERAVGNGARESRSRWLASERARAFEVQVQTTDDGIMLRLPDLARVRCRVDVIRDLDRRRSGAARARGGRRVVAVRRALPHERGARAAPAARQSAPAHAALAAATQGARSAPGGAGVSRRSRFSSRRTATCCRTRSTCRRCARARRSSPSGAIAMRVVETRAAVAVRRVAPVRLRHGLDVRATTRRAPSSAPRCCRSIARCSTS